MTIVSPMCFDSTNNMSRHLQKHLLCTQVIFCDIYITSYNPNNKTVREILVWLSLTDKKKREVSDVPRLTQMVCDRAVFWPKPPLLHWGFHPPHCLLPLILLLSFPAIKLQFGLNGRWVSFSSEMQGLFVYSSFIYLETLGWNLLRELRSLTV
jgi:hypothetical protein